MWLALASNKDGVTLRCMDRRCSSRQSVRRVSFFQDGNLSMHSQLRIICCFISGLTVTACSSLLNISRPTITEYYDNLRGEYEDLLSTNPIQFFDNGEYEVDECLLQHVTNRFGQQRPQWIAGIVERATGKLLLYRVADRSRATLLPPILHSIPTGSFIYSDDWSAYRALDNSEYSHFSVNHSAGEYARLEDFGGQELSVHINTMEGTFRRVRQLLGNKSRRNIPRIDLMLAELMYRNSGRDLYYPFKVK